MVLPVSLTAQNMSDIIKDMPDSIMPLLTKNDRLDFIDYLASNMKAEVTNRLGGKSEMTTISNNYAADLGGAIYMPNSGSAFTYIGEDAAGIEAHVSFIGNSAKDSGGAIYARNVIDISNAYFKDNSTTSGEGGAIVAYTIQMTMNDVIFDGNTSGTYGAAVYLSGSNGKEDVLELEGKKVTFKNNSGKLGALYVGSLVRVSMEDAIFENNHSGSYAGAIYTAGGTVDINGATFKKNHATSYGGAICYASLAIDYYQLGYQTGLMAAQILLGTKTPSDIAIATLTPSVSYNEELCELLGIQIPEN